MSNLISSAMAESEKELNELFNEELSAMVYVDKKKPHMKLFNLRVSSVEKILREHIQTQNKALLRAVKQTMIDVGYNKDQFEQILEEAITDSAKNAPTEITPDSK